MVQCIERPPSKATRPFQGLVIFTNTFWGKSRSVPHLLMLSEEQYGQSQQWEADWQVHTHCCAVTGLQCVNTVDI